MEKIIKELEKEYLFANQYRNDIYLSSVYLQYYNPQADKYKTINQIRDYIWFNDKKV